MKKYSLIIPATLALLSASPTVYSVQSVEREFAKKISPTQIDEQTKTEFRKVASYVKTVPFLYELSQLSCPSGTVNMSQKNEKHHLVLNNCKVNIGQIKGEMDIADQSFKKLGLEIQDSYAGHIKIATSQFKIENISKGEKKVTIPKGMIIFGKHQNKTENNIMVNRLIIKQSSLVFSKEQNNILAAGSMTTEEGFIGIITPLVLTQAGKLPKEGRLLYRNNEEEYLLVFENGQMRIEIPQD